MTPEGMELARHVVSEGTRRGVTVGAAESCTGGMVCAAITSVAGSSAVLRGGVVSYDPAVKQELLGVSQAIIDEPGVGVVSAECAGQMAQGACQALGCDLAVSVTGIAGPGGAEPGKPVGTVWFGLCVRGAVRTVCEHFSGDREAVREQAVERALSLLCEGIEQA